MRGKLPALTLTLILALGALGACSGQTQQSPAHQAQLLAGGNSSEHAKESLQGQSHGQNDGGHGDPSAGFGGLGPSHGGGHGPHK